MRDISPASPEARRKRLASMRAAFGTEVEEKLKPRLTPWEVVKRVAIGVYNDGFIHAGNLAYLSIVALFPFFIVAAAVAHLLGQGQDAMLTVTNVLHRLPPDVAATLQEPINEVLTVRTGNLLWLGAIVGLWTATSFVETIRDILRRAYGVKFCAPFWEYRLGSILLIIGAVLLLMIAFAVSAAMTIAHHFVMEWFPLAQNVGHALGLYGGYTRTYGSLAGVMIALIFFFVVGLGVVIGAELNAALAESGAKALKGEIYTGPYTDELEVEEPQPGEDVKPELETGGPRL
jgi:membrane protein